MDDPNIGEQEPKPSGGERTGFASQESALPPASPGAGDLTQVLFRQPGVKGHPILAWLIIISVAGYFAWDANRPQQRHPAQEPGISLPTQVTGKMIVAISQWLADDWLDHLLAQVQTLEKGPIADQLAYAVLIAEFSGPEPAREQLEKMARRSDPNGSASVATQATAMSKSQRQVVSILSRMYEARAQGISTVISADEQALLEQELGWFGRLAPLTRGTHDAAARDALLGSLGMLPLVLVMAGLWYSVCGLAGTAALIALLVLVLLGRLRRGFVDGTARGAIYAETFAVWLILFVGLRAAAQAIASERTMIAFNTAVAIAALAAVFWPLIRGLRWSVVRRDIGLIWPKRPAVEPAIGVLSYCTAMPLMFMGLLATVALMAVQQMISPEAPPPGHPAQQALAGADWLTIAQIMILGVIVAPIGEEIMFRGVLYRHLRDASNQMNLVASMIISALVSSLLFAGMHPQGWVTIPVLGGLAVGFCIAREWRGSLMACMIAHGLTNFVTLWLNVLLFRNG